MDISQFTVEVRGADLRRVGQLTGGDLSNFTVAPKANGVGSWTITLPERAIQPDGSTVPHELCARLREPGAGIIVTGPTGHVILSGPMTNPVSTATADSPGGSWEIEGVSDTVCIADSLAWGDPARPLHDQRTANDVRQGAAETVMREFVAANIGPGAIPARRNPMLRLAPDLARGRVLQKSPRFQNLLELLQEIATASGLLFDVVQTGELLEFQVREAPDMSGDIRMDIDNGQLTSSTYSYSAPALTRAVVAGQGEGTSRTLIERTSLAAVAAERAWQRRIERFLDQRQTDSITELEQAADEQLLDLGDTIRGLRVVPSADLDLTYGEHWVVGATITVIIGSQELRARVTEAPIRFGSDGVLAGAVLGDPTGFDWESVIEARSSAAEARISALERNSEASGSRTGTIDPYYTAGSPRVLFDGEDDFHPTPMPWLFPYQPHPGDRVQLTPRQGGGWVIQGMLIESASKQITISALALLTPQFRQYDTVWKEPCFTKTPDGIVLLGGLVAVNTSVSGSHRILTLPEGFRPDSTGVWPVAWNQTVGQIRVSSNGEVWWLNSGTLAPGQFLSLSGIAFPAAGVAAWKAVAASSSTEAAFASGWGNLVGEAPAAYWTDPWGFVWWRGAVVNGAAVTADNTPIIHLNNAPIRPSLYQHLGCASSSGWYQGVGCSPTSRALVAKRMATASTPAGYATWLSGLVTMSAKADTANQWNPMTLLNSWKSYDPAMYPTAAYTHRSGLVILRGLLNAGTVGTPFATLPDGFRPKGYGGTGANGLILQRSTNQASGRVDISPGGAIASVTGSNAWFSLDGAVYAAEQ